MIWKLLHQAWQRLPIAIHHRQRIRQRLFRKFPWPFRRTSAYRTWARSQADLGEPPPWGADPEAVWTPLRQGEPLEETPVRLIAFYLPQFHPIPENDAWWGKGFTEWTNVVRGSPRFDGHYQPHLPGELGFYDLRVPEVQKRQVELAKLYGISGFAFYFYWFAGKRLLERPLQQYLEDPLLNLPFCLCWANENWSRRWDGREKDILIRQRHSSKDDLAFIQYIERYIRDPRYIQIDGKPLLIVYRPDLLPSPIKTAARWRGWCQDNGIGEIHLSYTQAFEAEDPKTYGFDSAIEFPPNNTNAPLAIERVEQLDPAFEGLIFDWRVFPARSRTYESQGYKLFRGVNPGWDNDARRPGCGAVYLGSSPEGFQEWLENAARDTVERLSHPDERIVFINAWNEWAEGAHLEPDARYGYGYLEATRRALCALAEELKEGETGARRIPAPDPTLFVEP